jgi:hypothetical protein
MAAWRARHFVDRHSALAIRTREAYGAERYNEARKAA